MGAVAVTKLGVMAEKKIRNGWGSCWPRSGGQEQDPHCFARTTPLCYIPEGNPIGKYIVKPHKANRSIFLCAQCCGTVPIPRMLAGQGEGGIVYICLMAHNSRVWNVIRQAWGMASITHMRRAPLVLGSRVVNAVKYNNSNNTIK